MNKIWKNFDKTAAKHKIIPLLKSEFSMQENQKISPLPTHNPIIRCCQIVNQTHKLNSFVFLCSVVALSSFYALICFLDRIKRPKWIIFICQFGRVSFGEPFRGNFILFILLLLSLLQLTVTEAFNICINLSNLFKHVFFRDGDVLRGSFRIWVGCKILQLNEAHSTFAQICESCMP